MDLYNYNVSLILRFYVTYIGIYNGGLDRGFYEWYGPYWDENGQKESEGNFNDKTSDGLIIRWHENGQKNLKDT